MRRTMLAAVLSFLASPAIADDGYAGLDRLRSLVQLNGVLALWDASEQVAEADSVCEAAFGQWWQTHDPDHLSRITPRKDLNGALAWLCGTLKAQPPQGRARPLADIDRYALAYQGISVLADLASGEALGTAVAHVPAVSDLFPRDQASRERMGRDIGSTLASAEHTGLHRSLARRLSGLTQEEQAGIMRDLWVEALTK